MIDLTVLGAAGGGRDGGGDQPAAKKSDKVFPRDPLPLDGLKAVDPDMVNLVRTLGASRWQIFTKLQVPTALPFMFSGIKIGVSVSVIAAVIAEWVGASEGLGYLITYSQPLFLTARVFAAIVVLSVMGIALFVVAVRMTRRLDELKQRIQLEALAFAVIGMLLCTFCYGMVIQADVGAPALDWVWVWVITVVFYIAGNLVAWRRYR